MRIAILGAGAIGSSLAYRLSAAGNRVGILARGEALAAIRRDGIGFETQDGRRHAHVAAASEAIRLGPADIAIVTTKAPALSGMAGAIAAVDAPVLLFILNGIPWWYDRDGATAPPLAFLDPGGLIALAAAGRAVVGGVLYSAHQLVRPGVAQDFPVDRSDLLIGATAGEMPPEGHAFAAAAKAAGIAVRSTGCVRREVWSKLVTNIAVSPVCALAGEPLSILGRDAAMLELAKALMRDVIAVAGACGFELPHDPGTHFGPRHLGSSFKPSMLQDFEAGRVAEIDAILTAPRAFAREAGLLTPTLDRVTDAVVDKARRAGLYPPFQPSEGGHR